MATVHRLPCVVGLLGLLSLVGHAMYYISSSSHPGGAESLLMPAKIVPPSPPSPPPSPPPPKLLPERNLFVDANDAFLVARGSPPSPTLNARAMPANVNDRKRPRQIETPPLPPPIRLSRDKSSRAPPPSRRQATSALKIDSSSTVGTGASSSSSDSSISDSSSSSSDSSSRSLALHRSAKSWLDACANASTIASALPSSEYWRERRHYALYRHLFCVLQRYAGSARTALDVGSSVRSKK